MLISWILGVLEQDIARSVLYFNTARDIWLNLEERYGQSSGTLLFSLQQSLFEMKQGHDSVSSYYTRMKMIWDQLDVIDPIPACACTNCSCTIRDIMIKSQEDRLLVEFLMKLSDGFEIIRGGILVMSPLPSISHAYRLLLQEDNHKKLYQSSNVSADEVMEFAANRRVFQDRFKPYGYGNKQHFGQTETKWGNIYFCDHCKMSGHSISRCYKIHGYPQHYKTDRDRKFAAYAHGEDENCDKMDKFVRNNDNVTLTSTQYSQLMQLLVNNKIEENSDTKSAHVAEVFNDTTASW